MGKCSSCGERLPKERSRFCPNCGTPSRTVDVSSKEKKPVNQARQELSATLKVASTLLTPKNLSTQLRRIPLGMRIGIPAIVGILVAGFSIGSSIPGFLTPLTAAQMPSYSEVYSEAEKEANLGDMCSQLNSLIPEQATFIEFDRRQNLLAAIGGKDDGRVIRSLYLEESWFQDSNEKKGFVDKVNQVIDSALTKIVSSYEQMGVQDSNRPTLQKVWLKQFATDSKNRCDFVADEEYVIQKLSSYDAAIASGITKAERAPWYPVGFEEWDSEMAYKVSRDGVDCYDCTGLVYEFLSRYGCSSLYVEANHLDSQSRIYDWSNDTVNNLKEGDSAFLEFYSYSYPSGTTYTRISEVNCS